MRALNPGSDLRLERRSGARRFLFRPGLRRALLALSPLFALRRLNATHS